MVFSCCVARDDKPDEATAAWLRRLSELRVGALQLEDGRALSYHVDGDLGAGLPAVLLLHGMLSSRLLFVPETRPSDCVLVVPDRPGYGGSDAPRPGAGYAQLAADLKALMDALRISRCVVAGHSSGGPCALGVASVLGPARVAAVGCLASDAEYRHPSPRTPPDPMAREIMGSWAGPACERWFDWAPHLSGGLAAVLSGAARTAPATFVRDLLKPEEMHLWAEDGTQTFFQLALTASVKGGASFAGFEHDFLVERQGRWDFDASGVEGGVVVWCGELDDVAGGAARFLASSDVLPQADLHIVPKLGHLGVCESSVFNQFIRAVLHASQGSCHGSLACRAASVSDGRGLTPERSARAGG